MSDITKHIYNLFRYPFGPGLPYLVAGACLGSVAETVRLADYFSSVAYTWSANIAVAYVLLLLAGALPRVVRRIYLVILALLYVAVCMTDVFCYQLYGFCVNPNVMEILLATDAGEVTEFINTGISLSHMAAPVGTVLVCAGLWWLLRRVRLSGRAVLALSFPAMLCVALTARNYMSICDYTPPGKLALLFMREPMPSPSEFVTHPQVNVNAPLPANIVIVIGESFARKQSSVYGYDKPTNPLIGKMIADSCMLAFTNVESQEITTAASFRSFMSTFRGDNGPYYRNHNIVETMQAAGYKTFWLSNQSRVGVCDVQATAYARLCDAMQFSHAYSSMDKSIIDDALLPMIDTQTADKAPLRCFFIHLMGSHSDFSKRYPENFARFSPDDYPGKSEFCARTTAHYDNSLRFNDYIISQIIARFSSSETLLLYFSDHGLDFFDSSPDYCSHAKAAVPQSVEAGRKIPFFIYFSEKYAAAHPHTIERLRKSTDVKWCTVDLIYTLMDITGISIADIPAAEVASRSILIPAAQ